MQLEALNFELLSMMSNFWTRKHDQNEDTHCNMLKEKDNYYRSSLVLLWPTPTHYMKRFLVVSAHYSTVVLQILFYDFLLISCAIILYLLSYWSAGIESCLSNIKNSYFQIYLHTSIQKAEILNSNSLHVKIVYSSTLKSEQLF